MCSKRRMPYRKPDGVGNTYVSIIDVSMEKQPKIFGQLKVSSITQFNNFIFEEDGLRIVKAYGFVEERIPVPTRQRFVNIR